MTQAIVITPVKDALDNTLQTIARIGQSDAKVDYFIYNDRSSEATKSALIQESGKVGFGLIHVEDLTDQPSPNYKLVLIEGQKKALKAGLPLIIVESDVEVKPDTFTRMLDFYQQLPDTGLLGAITVDAEGKVNFPYLKFKNKHPKSGFTETNKSLSFCCTLISTRFLEQYDLALLDDTKHWYDTFLSDEAVRQGLKNYVLTDTTVLHKPHGSRPWKHLKYSNPLKYYWLKFIKNRDKI